MPERELYSMRISEVAEESAERRARFEASYGPGPRMRIQLGRTDYGWETYLTVGTKQLAELHVQIGAHLAKLAHAQAQQ